MLRLSGLHVIRPTCFIAISFLLSACHHAGPQHETAVETHEAGDIDVDRGTVSGREISTLAGVEVRLSGLVKSSPKGNTIMYLTRDRSEVEDESYRNCINLIIDKRLKVRSPDVSEQTFSGEFVLIDRFDPTIVYLTYKGIRFSTDCQALEQPERYPYFFVKQVE